MSFEVNMVEIAHLEIETPFGRLRGTKSQHCPARSHPNCRLGSTR
jgi:hypothetical protein